MARSEPYFTDALWLKSSEISKRRLQKGSST